MSSRRLFQFSNEEKKVEERDNDEAGETWQKLSGRSIIACERLQEKFDEAVTCRFCQGNVKLFENVGKKNGLGSTWMLQCRSESCPSHERNLAFSTTEKAGYLR